MVYKDSAVGKKTWVRETSDPVLGAGNSPLCLYAGEVTWPLRVGDWFPVQAGPGNPSPLSLLFLPRGSLVPVVESPSFPSPFQALFSHLG